MKNRQFPATHEEHISPHPPGAAPSTLADLFDGKAKKAGLSNKDLGGVKIPGGIGNPMK